MGRNYYLAKTTSELDLLIYTEGGIQVNQRWSTYENCGGRGGLQHKQRIGHTFNQQKMGTKDNTALVPGKDRKKLMLRATTVTSKVTSH